MIPAPVLSIMAVLGVVLVGIEQIPLPGPWGLIVRLAATAVAAVVTRSQVMPTAKATALVAEALKTETPVDPVESARQMVKR